MRKPAILLVVMLVATAAACWLLWGTRVPLGVPREWTWSRTHNRAAAFWGCFLAAPSLLAYLGFCVLGCWRMRKSARAEATVWLALLAVAAFAWLWQVKRAAPDSQGLGRAPFVLYDRGSSGYFWEARYEVKNTRQFLANYQDQMATSDYLHIGTHPPGLILVFRGLLSVCNNSPQLMRRLEGSQPEEVREAFRILARRARSDGDDDLINAAFWESHPVEPADVACLWLATLLVMAAAAATVVPIYLLVRRWTDRVAAWQAAALWPLVPAVSVFLPKADVLYPAIGAFAGWLWLAGMARGSYLRCAAAGFVMFGGMLLSLAFVPIGALLLIAAGIERAMARRAAGGVWLPPRWLGCIMAGAAGFLIPGLVLWLTTSCNIAAVWVWNFHNHSRFYDHNTRAYWPWLGVNAVELAIAVGSPVAVLAGNAVLRAFFNRQPWRVGSAAQSVAVATGIVLGLLWLSGKNMGEAARLWVLFFPWLVVAAGIHRTAAGRHGHSLRWPCSAVNSARAHAEPSASDSAAAPPSLSPVPLPTWYWWTVAFLQGLAGITTVIGVEGFTFTGG